MAITFASYDGISIVGSGADGDSETNRNVVSNMDSCIVVNRNATLGENNPEELAEWKHTCD